MGPFPNCREAIVFGVAVGVSVGTRRRAAGRAPRARALEAPRLAQRAAARGGGRVLGRVRDARLRASALAPPPSVGRHTAARAWPARRKRGRGASAASGASGSYGRPSPAAARRACPMASVRESRPRRLGCRHREGAGRGTSSPAAMSSSATNSTRPPVGAARLMTFGLPASQPSPVPVQMWHGGEPSPGADVAAADLVPVQMWHGADPVLVQMWQRRAQSRCRCGSGGFSSSADVAGVRITRVVEHCASGAQQRAYHVTGQLVGERELVQPATVYIYFEFTS